MRSWSTLVEPRGQVAEWGLTSFWLYNGDYSITKSNREKEYLISKSSKAMWMVPVPQALTGERHVLNTLDDWEANRNPAVLVSKGTRREGGVSLFDFEVKFPATGWKNVVSLLPDREYCVHRYEVTNASGGRVTQYDTQVIEDVAGRPYPHRASQKHYLANNKLGYTRVMEVQSVTTDPSRVPDSLFEFDTPADSVLFDRDLKAIVRRSESAESHLDDAVRGLESQSLWQRWRAVFAGGAVAACVAALLVLRTRRARRV